MQLLKISFILGLVGSLCSFAYYSASEDGREQLYKKFLGEFEQINLPSSLTLRANIITDKTKSTDHKERTEKLEPKIGTSKILGKEYVSFIPGIERGMISRMGPNRYKAELALATSGKYSAVIYSESRAFDGVGRSFILATFDAKGQSIGTHNLAYVDLEQEAEVTISEKMEFTLKTLLIKEDVKSYKEEATKKVFITPKGEIMVHKVGDSHQKMSLKQAVKNT